MVTFFRKREELKWRGEGSLFVWAPSTGNFISATAMTKGMQDLNKTTNGLCILLCIYILTFPHSELCLVLTLAPLRICRYPLWMSFYLTFFPITHATNFLLVGLAIISEPRNHILLFLPCSNFLFAVYCFQNPYLCSPALEFFTPKWPKHCKENGESPLTVWRWLNDLLLS